MASELKTNIIFKMEPYPPVIEKECPKDSLVIQEPMNVLKSGKVNKVDVLFSYNTHEALYGLSLYESHLLEQYNRFPELFVPSLILNTSTADQILQLSDKIIKFFMGDKKISFDNFLEFLNYASSASFVYGTQKFFREWPEVGNRYFFKFSSYSSRNYYGLKVARYGIVGASHFNDIFYIYNAKSMNMSLERDSIEYKMVQQITTAITNFVKYG